jgi:hypothetical protein
MTTQITTGAVATRRRSTGSTSTMARHDYDLPADYEKRVQEGTMSEWYTHERAKRQALRQDTQFEKEYTGLRGRIERLLDAASETVDIER